MTNSNENNPPATFARILNVKEVCYRVGISRAALYRWVAAGLFPKPVRIGVNRIGWRDYVVEDWIRSLNRDDDSSDTTSLPRSPKIPSGHSGESASPSR